jgi:uncharacterized protein
LKEANGLSVRERPGGLVFPVRVQPKASQDEVVGIKDGALWVRVTAPPIGGKANEACVLLLASALGVPRGSVALTGGHRSRNKLMQISGISLDQLQVAMTGWLAKGQVQ